MFDVHYASQSFGSTGATMQLTSTDTQAADLGGSIAFAGQDGAIAARTFAVIAGRKENSTGSNYAGYLAFATRANGSVPVEAMRITSAGLVGIGTTPSAEKLEVNGNVKATSFISTSDERLKENIQTSPGLDVITRLTGVSWQWRNNQVHDAGVIAQQTEKVLPWAVITDAKTGYKAVKYNALFAPLIESTKELYGMCKANGDAIESLKQENLSLSRDLASVKVENQRLSSEMEQIKAQQQELLRRLEALEKRSQP
ncbi:MAG: hypothetical protein COT73_02235 [Bdellovibrio sp. CG10_big_fil_rev_8_21_14_0_10_47_8]|nr:MAG: hypothetical protein COT73_02235 [Bdellovibrio sp. CG10_big_fil_rev_8_21_14_0_10_47_8]